MSEYGALHTEEWEPLSNLHQCRGTIPYDAFPMQSPLKWMEADLAELLLMSTDLTLYKFPLDCTWYLSLPRSRSGHTKRLKLVSNGHLPKSGNCMIKSFDTRYCFCKNMTIENRISSINYLLVIHWIFFFKKSLITGAFFKKKMLNWLRVFHFLGSFCSQKQVKPKQTNTKVCILAH